MFLEELLGSYKILVIKRTYNIHEVHDILSNPALWRAISNDDADIASSSVEDKRSHIHLIGYVDSNPIAVFVVYPDIRKDYYCYGLVLPKYRNKYARDFGKLAVSWIWDNTNILELNAAIADTTSNVKNFAKVTGFTEAGYSTKKVGKSAIGIWHMKIKNKSPTSIKKHKKV